MNELLSRAIDTLTYPADDLQATLVVVLAVVTFGLLITFTLFALTSTRNRRTYEQSDFTDNETPEE